jgi:RNA recognition motif-containing protein
MNNKLFVGNLPFSVNSDGLKELFAPHGNVVSANVIVDRASGRSKGFGFVEMSTGEEAEAAVTALNNVEVSGRKIAVAEAKGEQRKPGSGGGHGGNRGGRGREREDY